MPSLNALVQFKSGKFSDYQAIEQKDLNALYFCNDTFQLFLGEDEYTKSVTRLNAAPSTGTTVGEPGKVYVYGTTVYICEANTDGAYNKWTAIANNYTYNHPNSGATAGTYGQVTINAQGHVTAGTVISDVAHGGTGKGSFTSNALLKGNGTGALAEIAPGATGQVLKMTASGPAWGTDNNTTYAVFKAATSSAAGGTGLVPAPAAGKHTSFLRGDGTWVIPTDTNTTYTFATGTADGTIKVTPSGGSATDYKIAGWDNLAKKSDITKIVRLKGTVATVGDLPDDAEEGDVYHVTADHSEYVWMTVDGNPDPSWENLGPLADMSLYALKTEVIQRVTGATGMVPKFNADGTLSSTGFTLGISVPANAKFTDTVYTHPNYGSAGTYGDTGATRTLAWGGSFKVSKIVTNATGHADIEDITLTLPANPNTDTKVNMSARGTTKAYILGTTTAPKSSAAGVTSVAETGVYFDTTAATLVATTFKGALTGNATSASKLATARAIAVSGAVTGTINFDGSAAVTIPTALANFASNKVTALTGYTVAPTYAAVAATDSLNVAIGKLQKGVTEAKSAASSASLKWGSF